MSTISADPNAEAAFFPLGRYAAVGTLNLDAGLINVNVQVTVNFGSPKVNCISFINPIDVVTDAIA